MTTHRTRSIAHLARRGLLAAAAAMVLGIAPAVQAQQAVEPGGAEHQLMLSALDHELSQMEAQLWHATAAVLFHVADGDLDALADYENDVAGFKEYLALAAGRISERLRDRYAHIEMDWKTHRQIASALLAAAKAEEGDGGEHQRLIAELWAKAMEINASVDRIRDAAIAGWDQPD